MDLLRPGYDRVSARELPEDEQPGALEREAVLVSLENLMTFPFVKEAVDSQQLTLHGLWTEIGEGDLEYYDTGAGRFLPV